jgi:hypothetical protein
MVDSDFQKDLEAVSERAISADSRSSDNTVEIGKLKQVCDGQQSAIGRHSELLTADKATLDDIRGQLDAQKGINAEQHRSIEDLKRQVEIATARLNGDAGTGLEKQASLERMRASVTDVVDLISGGNGELSFRDIRTTIAQTKFTGQLAKGAIGLFGASTVLGGLWAIVSPSLNGDALPPQVQLIQQQVKEQGDKLKDLGAKFEAMRDRELNRGAKP